MILAILYLASGICAICYFTLQVIFLININKIKYEIRWGYIEAGIADKLVYELSDEEKLLLLFNDNSFTIFCHDKNINDLHEENFGYLNGKCVIIDWSRYQEGK